MTLFVKGSVVPHMLLERAERSFIPLCRDAPDGQIIVLVGATQSGKSIVFDRVVKELRSAFVNHGQGRLPVVELQVETVNDGRVKPKWLGIELLKALKHPMYQHIGALDEASYYKPAKGRDEGTIRIALKEALAHRETRRVCLDEAHLLTRSRDPEVRANILESIKSSCAINRTLIVCGGYELAYRGLFDSSHFAGRVTLVDFGHYKWSIETHRVAWKRALRTYANHMKLATPNLLRDRAEFLMAATNGVFGALHKWMWRCDTIARSYNQNITDELLRLWAPPAHEVKAIRADIVAGTSAVAGVTEGASASELVERGMPPTSGTKANDTRCKRKPFQRQPRRDAGRPIEIDETDLVPAEGCSR